MQQACALRQQPAKAAAIAVARPKLPQACAIVPYLERVDAARWYSNFGPLLTEFESRLADRFARPTRVITVANATQGLELLLRALQPTEGAYVILPAWTFVATAHAVLQAGLRPWFADVDQDSGMLEPKVVAAMLAKADGPIAAVIPVSPFGQPLDLAAWRDFRRTTGTPVLIDAAAGFDTVDDAGLPVVVSLHATKVVGVGEGGYVATEDEELAERVRMLSSFGFRGTRESLLPATNAKLSEYTAAVGLAALDSWPGDRLRFLRASQMLRVALMDLPEVVFQLGWGIDWVTSVCSVTVPDGAADVVERGLAAREVDTRRWWGAGCHASPAFEHCRREDLSVTDRLGRSVIGLPFSIDLSPAEIGRIAEALQETLVG